MEDKDRSGNRERAVEDRVVRESGGNERTGGAEGGINETRAHSCRQRNKEEELWGSKWVKVKR